MSTWACAECADGIRHPFAHGQNGYRRHRCRCEVCLTAYTERVKREREIRRANPEQHLKRKRDEAARRGQESKERGLAQHREYHNRNRECRNATERRRKNKMQTRIPSPRNGSRWTAAEDAIILRDDLSLIARCFMLGRSYAAVQARRYAITNPEGNVERYRRATGLDDGIPAAKNHNPWTADEDAVIRCDDLTRAEQARILGRSHHAVAHRRREICNPEGVSSNRRRSKEFGDSFPTSRNGFPWTADEDAIVLREDLSVAEQCSMLSRGYWATKTRRNVLRNNPMHSESVGSIPWSPDDDAVLLLDGLTDDERSVMLGRSANAVRNRRMRISKQTEARHYPRGASPWTADEDAVIRRDDLTRVEQARMLGRSVEAIWTRRTRLRKQAA